MVYQYRGHQTQRLTYIVLALSLMAIGSRSEHQNVTDLPQSQFGRENPDNDPEFSFPSITGTPQQRPTVPQPGNPNNDPELSFGPLRTTPQDITLVTQVENPENDPDFSFNPVSGLERHPQAISRHRTPEDDQEFSFGPLIGRVGMTHLSPEDDPEFSFRPIMGSRPLSPETTRPGNPDDDEDFSFGPQAHTTSAGVDDRRSLIEGVLMDNARSKAASRQSYRCRDDMVTGKRFSMNPLVKNF